MDSRADTLPRARNRVIDALGVLRRWPYTFVVLLSIFVGSLALAVSAYLGIPVRDPEGFLGPSYVRLPALGILFVAGGISIQSIARARSLRVWGEAKRIISEEWTWARLAHVGLGLIAFYVCYVSYRNLKGFLPIVLDGVQYDAALTKLDQWLFFGRYPALVLHDWLGTGIAAQVLSTFYISYLILVPISLAALLVWNRDISLGAWYATALSLNWVLGVASYYALPTVGPAFENNALTFNLPTDTGVAALQQSLAQTRYKFLSDPFAGGINGIAGFASLHVSVVVTACVFLRRTNAHRAIRTVAWAFLVLTITATLYFGWHFIVDDVAGAVIGWAAVAIGAWATGNTKRQKSRGLSDSADTEPVVWSSGRD